MRMVFRVLAFVFAVALAHTVLAGAKTLAAGEIPEEKRFVFLSSTIGPIEAGIVPALEEAFEKDTGIRVRLVGAGTGVKFPRVLSAAAEAFVAWVVDPAKGQAIIRDFGKEKFGAPLFFPNSTEYRKAAGLPAGDF